MKEWGASDGAANAVAAANAAVDKDQDPDHAYKHSQTNCKSDDQCDESKAKEKRNDEEKLLMKTACEAAKRGDYGTAYDCLGEMMHPRQDEHWHNWACQLHQHTGSAVKSIASVIPVLGWILFEVTPFGVVYDINDLIPHDEECEADVRAVMSEFEKQVSNQDVIDGMKAWKPKEEASGPLPEKRMSGPM